MRYENDMKDTDIKNSDKNSAILTCLHLNAFYGKKKILSDISFELKSSDFVFLCGPNGCGKSTLLSSLAGIKNGSMNFSENSILFGNNAIESLKRNEISSKASFMSQNESCIWDFSVEKFISLGRFIHNDEKSEYASKLVEKYMEEMGILDLRGESVRNISGGEFQKCRIARSLVQETSFLLLDEPVASLDMDAQVSLLKKLKELCHHDKKAIIVSIHDLNLASIFADKILLLKKCQTEKSCEPKKDERTFIFGSVDEVFSVQNLQAAYGTEFTLFTHPVYGVKQVCVKS